MSLVVIPAEAGIHLRTGYWVYGMKKMEKCEERRR